MSEQLYQFGMIGLGTMGSNLVLNMADHGFAVAGYDKDPQKVSAFNNEAGDRKIKAFASTETFIASLQTPRVIMMLVPAGKIVDAVINDLKPFLSKEDLLIDCGNSHFTDTDARVASLAKDGIHFMGTGVSGGETGARFGPSIMPGGPEASYARIAPMLRAIAAKVNEESCVAHMGTGSAGHYVKMVHNGIEYAIMQMISETYHLLKQVGGLSNAEIKDVFEGYNKSAIQSYLIEITAAVLSQKDEITGNDLVDMILDKAHQKGTGAWTSQDAMNLAVPVPSIDAAVSQREITTIKELRTAASSKLHAMDDEISVENSGLIKLLEDAMHFCMITIYAQGLSLLREASVKYNYGVNPAKVASIWRGGCIIRSAMLEDIRAAFNDDPSLTNIMIHDNFSSALNKLQVHSRSAIVTAINAGIPVPVMTACVHYFDSYRSTWLPANLIQAQRDFFGAHTYERTDKPGNFHTEWNIKIN
ncbi:MAG: NADP-dependent phosphogluconate dehydrogenase [Ferruginibacter sp.]